MSATHNPIGRIVGEATPTEFLFVAKKENHPPKYEYVSIYSYEQVGKELRKVEVLAQVTRVISRSNAYTVNADFDTLEKIYQAGIDDVNVICVARTLGYLSQENERTLIKMPRRAIYPGNEVYIASDELVKNFFSYPEEEGLHIGYLISRPSVPVYISLNGFRRHLAILAQTGAGKSYTVGVLVEELLEKGGTVIIIDPHADYVFLSRLKDGGYHPLRRRIKVFRNPNSTGRYSAESLDNVVPYTIKFSDLTVDEISEILEIPERWTNIRRAIHQAISNLQKNDQSYTVSDLIAELDKIAGDENGAREIREGAKRATEYVRRLERIRVFGERTTSIDEMLQPMHVSVIDLSGLNNPSMDYITYRILTEVYDKVFKKEYPYPVFIVIEEAHRFVPPKKQGKTKSRGIIDIIAAEGRKFGVFLILVSQRPSKIDSDALSQCNSQIILKVSNPQDQKAIIDSSERMSESLMSDLPGLNVGEAIIVGEITKVPVLVKIRERKTMEGGADIDIVKALKSARRDVKIDKNIEKINIEKALFSNV